MDVGGTVAALAALAAGPWLLWNGFRCLRIARLIGNTPTARIRSMAMGLVEVCGQVRARSAQTAPFSGRPCVYWEVDVSVRNRRGWTVVRREQSGRPFFLSDETGVAMVYPTGASCRIRFGTDETVFGLVPPSPYAEYLGRNPSLVTTVARLSMMRFRERTLEDGQRVYVMGTAMPRSRGDEVSGGGTPGEGHDDGPLRELDRGMAAVIRRGENESTFIISQEKEHVVESTMRWKAAAMILGGPPLALFGLGYWLSALASGRMPR